MTISNPAIESLNREWAQACHDMISARRGMRDAQAALEMAMGELNEANVRRESLTDAILKLGGGFSDVDLQLLAKADGKEPIDG